MAYKVIAKLLASRVKKVLPKLVNEKHTRFVPKRQILDNISTAHLVRNRLRRIINQFYL
jgi:hypothetical protein